MFNRQASYAPVAQFNLPGIWKWPLEENNSKTKNQHIPFRVWVGARVPQIFYVIDIILRYHIPICVNVYGQVHLEWPFLTKKI